MTQTQHALVAEDLWWFLDSLIAIRADKVKTDGKLGISENWAPRGGGSPLHTHSKEDETFVVLEGELHFWLGDETFQQGPGGTAFLPRSRQHAFSVTSETAHFMVIITPGGFEDFYRTGRRAVDATFPPEPPTRDDFKRAMDMAVSLGASIDGPPPTA
jgi:mannose-6-phosphate isomerase-like protein (cupin superfamily)